MFGPLEDMARVPDLTEAACKGNLYFATSHLSRSQAKALVQVCLRECPVFEACREQRDKYRVERPWEWHGFNGVWAGQAFVRGKLRDLDAPEKRGGRHGDT